MKKVILSSGPSPGVNAQSSDWQVRTHRVPRTMCHVVTSYAAGKEDNVRQQYKFLISGRQGNLGLKAVHCDPSAEAPTTSRQEEDLR